jgi:hypothetical protein
MVSIKITGNEGGMSEITTFFLPIIQEGEDFFFLHTSCYKTITKNPFKL